MPSLEETLTCPICLDLFDDPRILPCSHTFCGKCLHATGRHSAMITCPLCRYHFIKQALPINRIVLSLVEQHRQEKTLTNITAKCYDCKSYSQLDLCGHCDTLLCQRCHHRHDFEWKNRDVRTKNLLLSKGSCLRAEHFRLVRCFSSSSQLVKVSTDASFTSRTTLSDVEQTARDRFKTNQSSSSDPSAAIP